jgi:predicted unusual protein kinase regulating ubiquinone biosynthesis (AarF/ABC1/UbiB family)
MAASLRDTLIRLGPTFIKIGQLMSTRVDVLPVEVLNELRGPASECL